MGLVAAVKVVKIRRKKEKEAQVLSSHLYIHLATWWLFLLLGVFSTETILFGDVITCNIHSKAVSEKMFTTHCWRAESYSIPLEGSRPAAQHQAPDERRHQAYYQWVSLALLLQGLAAFLPVWLWRRLEAGKLTRLLTPLLQLPLIETPVAGQVRSAAIFLRAHPDWYRAEALACLACELLALALTLGQVFAMDIMLGGQFVTILQPTQLATVFPRLVGCSMPAYGPSGSPVEVSGLCVLNFNVIHEKIYAVLWVWYLLLAMASALLVAWQAALLLVPALRLGSLWARTGRWHPGLTYARLVLLHRLADNIDITQMEEMVEQLVNGPQEEAVKEEETVIELVGEGEQEDE